MHRHAMHPRRALAVIIGRAGSKGLPGKNALMLAGRPMICHTIDDALCARCVDRIIVSTDSEVIASTARSMSVDVIPRPRELASDTATVDAAVRHAVDASSTTHDVIVILYANVPIRPHDLIDRAVDMLITTGCDSVQSYCEVGKHHPYWMVGLDGSGRVRPHVQNTVYRRQDLPKLLIPDGGVIAVTRSSLFTVVQGQPHAFLGADRRGIENPPGAVIDVDSPIDLAVAEAMLAPQLGTDMPSDPMKIGQREIGSSHPPYIIAELGVNHDGSVGCAIELVRAAATAGASAIKLQLFDADRLLSRAAMLAGYQSDSGECDPFEMLRRLQLSAIQMRPVIDEAHARGLDAIVTVFSLSLVDDAERLPIDAYKTASPDIINRPLIERLMATGKPLLLSTGAATLEEVRQATQWLGDHPHILMQCVSAYPTPDECASLAARLALADISARALGYSDHTTAIETGALAVASGACVLEKHLTHNRPATGPDHAASLDPPGFAEYVRHAHRAWQMVGQREKVVLPIEQEVRRLSRQSLTSARPIAAGHVITAADVAIKRPGHGLPPSLLHDIIGRRAVRAIAFDTPITDDDLA